SLLVRRCAGDAAPPWPTGRGDRAEAGAVGVGAVTGVGVQPHPGDVCRLRRRAATARWRSGAGFQSGGRWCGVCHLSQKAPGEPALIASGLAGPTGTDGSGGSLATASVTGRAHGGAADTGAVCDLSARSPATLVALLGELKGVMTQPRTNRRG